MPTPEWELFLAACQTDAETLSQNPSTPESGLLVTVLYDAGRDARATLQMLAGQIIPSIADGVLEDVRVSNTKPWEKAPKGEEGAMVYSFTFTTETKEGYIAVIQRVSNKEKWIVKSLKSNDGTTARSINRGKGK